MGELTMTLSRTWIFAFGALIALVLACSESTTPASTPVAPESTAQPTAAAQPTPEPTPTSKPTPDPLAGLFPLSVTDSRGREIVFDEPPARIIAFDSAVVETLFAIGEGARVIGTHDFVTYPPEADDIPRLGSAFSINIEQSVALKPDLIFLFSDGFVDELESAGLKVLYQESLTNDFTRVADTVRLWGRITGALEPAEEVSAAFEKRVEVLQTVFGSVNDGPSVFQDEGELWTPGPDTLFGEVFELLKLNNIAHDVDGYAQLSPEIIVERNPDIVIASYGDSFSTNAAFSDVRAVKDERIYAPSSDALSIAGPRFVDGVEELARFVYPELFSQ